MQAFEIADLLKKRASGGELYHEFLRVPALSAGVYVLAAGADDPQQPHARDEVYYVVAGRGAIQVDGEDRAVEPGSVIYVAAQVPHHFHSIADDLEILVFFAPPEG